MNDPTRVDVASGVVRPRCVIGYRRLTEASEGSRRARAPRRWPTVGRVRPHRAVPGDCARRRTVRTHPDEVLP